MIYGYARVSTEEQDNEKFHPALIAAGATEIFEEKISGAKPWKTRKLAHILKIASPGDGIVSPELSRYGRNLLDVLDFISAARAARITVSAIKDNLTIRPDGDAASDLMLHVLAAAAQFERARLSERVKEGLVRAKANGKQLGGYRRKGMKVSDLTLQDKEESYRYGGATHHPKKTDIIRAVRAGGSIAGTARAYDVSRQTIYRWLGNG